MVEEKMAKDSEKSSRPSAPDAEDSKPDQDGQSDNTTAVMDFIERLDEQEKMLVLLQNELYEGSWQAMLNDLRNRLEGKPYIFKLANRIRDDIARIEKIMAFEENLQVKLSDFIRPPTT